MESALELLPAGGRGRRNRKWPDEVKARLVPDPWQLAVLDPFDDLGWKSPVAFEQWAA